MKRNPILAFLTVCALTSALGQNDARAQSKPFQIIGAGIATTGLPLPGQPPREHWAVGIGTDLGLYEGDGEVETDTANFLPNGDITGLFGSPVPFRFVGSNGDVLACYYGNTDFGAANPGTFELIPVPDLGPGVYVAHFLAEFVPYLPGCTGKFEGVTGSWIMYASTEPFVLGASDPVGYWWTGSGSLTLKKGH